MPSQKPRQNWIYMIDPKLVALRCKNGHRHVYDISTLPELSCFESNCNLKINSSKVMRGKHPHIIWSEYSYGKFHAYHVIPLTSKETFKGLPTVYPINKNAQNALDKNSLALVHQLTMIDSECLKDANGDWIQRIGVLSKNDREAIELRLKFALNLPETQNDTWFTENASPELLKKVFLELNEKQQKDSIEDLLDYL